MCCKKMKTAFPGSTHSSLQSGGVFEMHWQRKKPSSGPFHNSELRMD